MIGDRMRLVLTLVFGAMVVAGLVFGGRAVYRMVRGDEAQPAATQVVQTPVPSPTEWGAELFPTTTPTPTPMPTSTATPAKTGVDAFGLPEGYQPEVAAEEEIPDLKKLVPSVTPGVPPASGLDVVEEVLKKGKEIVSQVSETATTPTPESTAASVRVCRFWVFGCKDVTPTPTPTPTPIPGWVEQLYPGLMDKAGEKAAEVWQAIVGPTPTPTPQPKGGIAGTGIPLWPVILVVIGVLVVVAFRAGFIGIESD